MKKKMVISVIGLAFLVLWNFPLKSVNAQNKSAFEEILTNISPSAGVKKVPQMIEDSKTMGAVFERRELFENTARAITDNDVLNDAVGEGVLINLDKAAIARILNENVQFLNLPLPDEKGGVIELELSKVDIFAPGFNVETSAPTGESYEKNYGIHYRGMIKGDPISLVAISIFQKEIMGSIRSKTLGNSVLGRLEGNNPTDRHIFYDVNKLKSRPENFCNVKNSRGESLPVLIPQEQLQNAVSARFIRKYVEANFDVFQNKGSVAATLTYITGFFNQSATLFANDGVFISLQTTFVWNSPSPYTATDDSEVDLNLFKATRTTFNGDLAHLITLKNYGGIAFLNVLCDPTNRYAVSGIHDNFMTVPTFSWTVEVFTHETGHNLGSPHTHACAWNGNNTAIDSCATVEGGCASPGNPAAGGTIMSYCHLQNNGINFTLGFGTQPKALILNRIGAATCLTNSSRPAFDFDGDNKTDVGIFRPALGQWWYLRSSDNSNRAFQFGQSTDKIAAADYTGDGKTDLAFFRPASGEWFVLRSEDSSFYSFPFGNSTDTPTPADFDGDGKADPAIFRASNQTWYINRSSDNQTTITPFGIAGDVPVAADYDGDNKADIGIYRPSNGQWWLNRSTGGLVVSTFGTSSDKTVQADYTGDGKADVAFFRPSTREWFVLRSENATFYSAPFGAAGDIASPGDYDGDGKSDLAIFRPSNNTWYLQQSTSGFTAITFGTTNDIPLPNSYVR